MGVRPQLSEKLRLEAGAMGHFLSKHPGGYAIPGPPSLRVLHSDAYITHPRGWQDCLSWEFFQFPKVLVMFSENVKLKAAFPLFAVYLYI